MTSTQTSRLLFNREHSTNRTSSLNPMKYRCWAGSRQTWPMYTMMDRPAGVKHKNCHRNFPWKCDNCIRTQILRNFQFIFGPRRPEFWLPVISSPVAVLTVRVGLLTSFGQLTSVSWRSLDMYISRQEAVWWIPTFCCTSWVGLFNLARRPLSTKTEYHLNLKTQNFVESHIVEQETLYCDQPRSC